ncbi:hypothetical protein HGRIS_000051 [Hohenbuehelia grisea]|uniref:Uncharacterized protein n=1 Tax=Hohenbuehelia grisea TaxID=104357 RepID=A0ABR3JQ27_9AGAR
MSPKGTIEKLAVESPKIDLLIIDHVDTVLAPSSHSDPIYQFSSYVLSLSSHHGACTNALRSFETTGAVCTHARFHVLRQIVLQSDRDRATHDPPDLPPPHALSDTL